MKKADTERFLALVKKYRDCHELTDAMLYSFIDRVEVHEATGGRTIYRKQNIDIYFNFRKKNGLPPLMQNSIVRSRKKANGPVNASSRS